jgi:uncharacterized protein (TIGR00369 family)
MFAKSLATARDNRDFNTLIKAVPYAKLLGMKSYHIGDELMFVLPAIEDNIGNPTLPAIHGGALGGFMESAAIFHALGSVDSERVPKVIDFSIDYLRPGRYQDTYAMCEIVRQGRKVLNVSVSAWQNKRSEPIANARTHLLL